MAYLGRGLDKISNIEVLDNITFDGSSSYSITKGSVAFTPNSAQSCLISIDGVVQATNFTVSSSTIDFGVAIPSTSVCNFFLHYGTGVMTVPSDGSVTTAKLGDDAVTGAKLSKPFNYDSGTFYLDDTNNKVGIGTTSPSYPLEVNGTVRTVGTNNLPALIVDANSTDEGDIAVADGQVLTFGHHTLDGNTGSFTERMRIGTNGALNVLANGTTKETWSPSRDSHQIINNDTGDVVLTVKADTSSYASNVMRALCDRGGNSGYSFLTCTSGNLTDDQFILRGEGNAYADGSWNGGGADYAEYFEWHDGNTSNEDRRGYTVVLDGNKIRKSTNEDNTNNIIGVISGNPSVVGDNDIGRWKNKYQKDNYGSHILDENGDRILNTEYDENQNYISREDRQEWDIVGLMGKVRINKGQPVGDRWIKMRDISETVEEWLIR